MDWDQNRADDGSKGLKIGTLIKNDRWLVGPKFLWEDEAQWPTMIKGTVSYETTLTWTLKGVPKDRSSTLQVCISVRWNLLSKSLTQKLCLSI